MSDRYYIVQEVYDFRDHKTYVSLEREIVEPYGLVSFTRLEDAIDRVKDRQSNNIPLENYWCGIARRLPADLQIEIAKECKDHKVSFYQPEVSEVLLGESDVVAKNQGRKPKC